MQITETLAEGLKRQYTIIIPAAEIQAKVEKGLTELARDVKLPGFRPGKIPLTILKQRFGQSVMGDVLEQAVNDSMAETIRDRGLRPAMDPKVEVVSFAPDTDLEYKMAVELLPDIEPPAVDDIELERIKVIIEDERVDAALDRLAESRRQHTPLAEPRPAAMGDMVVLDFDGTVDGEALPGMKGDDHELVLGSKRFVDSFEEQLVGVQTGDERTVTVRFPDDYPAEALKGRTALFAVKVKDIRAAEPITIDAAFAEQFGMESLDALRDRVRADLAEGYSDLIRARTKRALLDKLAERVTFEAPPGMVELEFEAIWKRLQEELASGNAPDDSGKSEDELRTEYRAIAERRVKLGLLLAEIGKRSQIEVTRDELSRAVVQEARRYPGQEREVYAFFQNNRDAVERLRAPLYEDKVIDHLLEQVKLTERLVSVADLLAMTEADMRDEPGAAVTDGAVADQTASDQAQAQPSA